MKLVFALAVLALVAVVAANIVVNSELTEDQIHNHWAGFKSRFEKTYSGAEHDRRFQIFRDNLRRMKEASAADPSAQYGINKFADLHPDEFKATYLSTKTMDRESMKNALGSYVEAPLLDASAAPTAWDWRDHGAVTPVKNQGQCGSCWSFSTTGNVEGQWFLKTGQLVSLSEQNLVDCSHNCDPSDARSCNAGCNGGLMNLAYEYIIKNGGIDTEASYPYEGIDLSCRFKSNSIGAKVSNWTLISTDEDQMAAWLSSNGPISIAVNAGPLQYYLGGISDPVLCNPKNLDHGVLLVGYGVGKNWLGKETPYWLVKNSWGTTWGEKGYYQIVRGKNKCGVAEIPMSSIV